MNLPREKYYQCVQCEKVSTMFSKTSFNKNQYCMASLSIISREGYGHDPYINGKSALALYS